MATDKDCHVNVSVNGDVVSISSDGNISLSVNDADMLKMTGTSLEEQRRLAGIDLHEHGRQVAEEIFRSRTKEELDVLQPKVEEAMRKLVDGYGDHTHSVSPGPSGPPTPSCGPLYFVPNGSEELRKLEEENTKLRSLLAQAQSDADRLRGGVTEKKRYMKMNPASNRPLEVEGQHYQDHLLEIDGKVEHLVVVQDLGHNFAPEQHTKLGQALDKHFGRQVLLVVTRPGIEFSVLELTR